MHKLYSMKKSTHGLLTSFVFVMMAVLFAQPLAAQPDSLRPDIRFFSPVSARQGTLIDIVGVNFSGTTGVSFGGTPAASIQVLSDSLIRAKVGTGSSGFVRVTTPFGTDSLGGFTFIRDTLPPDSLRPDITSFTPRSARTGQNVFIFGKHFTGATSVSFGNVPAQSYVVFADTGIRAVVGPGASGVVRVATSFGADTMGGFTFIRDTLPPDITSFTPTSARQGQNVFIFGKRFTGATSVSFGNVPASFTVFADSGIKAIVGPGASGAVRVVTPFGSDTLGGFTFIRDTLPPDSFPPVIASFTPTAARTGTNVFIFGKHFTGATAVSFGNVPAQSYTVFADTGIRAVVGLGASGAVKVKTPFGIDSLNGFTYIRDTIPSDSLAPHISDFSPKYGSIGSFVFITGKHFKGTTAISFGGVTAASYKILSDSSIQARVGLGATGAVRVVTPFGIDSLDGFEYRRGPDPADTFPPKILSFSPTTGTKGTTVTITGKHFKYATAVSFGGVPPAFWSTLSDTIIKARIDTGATGVVKVVTMFGSDTLGTFTYTSPMTVQYTVTVAPNPTTGYAIVTHPVNAGYAQLKLTDITGNVVQTVKVSSNVSQTRLNLAGVKPGVYKLTWNDGKGLSSITLLVK